MIPPKKNSINQMIQNSMESITNRMDHMEAEIRGFENEGELDHLVKVSDKKCDWQEQMRSVRHSKNTLFIKYMHKLGDLGAKDTENTFNKKIQIQGKRRPSRYKRHK